MPRLCQSVQNSQNWGAVAGAQQHRKKDEKKCSRFDFRFRCCRAQKSAQQGCASWLQDPGYWVPSPGNWHVHKAARNENEISCLWRHHLNTFDNKTRHRTMNCQGAPSNMAKSGESKRPFVAGISASQEFGYTEINSWLISNTFNESNLYLIGYHKIIIILFFQIQHSWPFAKC